MGFSVTVNATALQPGGFDQSKQRLIILGSRRLRFSQLGAVTARMDVQGQAQASN
jgi:hypothetical protein